MKIKPAITILALTLMLTGCTSSVSSDNSSNSEDQKTGVSQSAGCDESQKACLPEETAAADPAENPDFVPMSFDEAIQFFEEGKSGLLYFGFPDCPWCKELFPVLSQSLKDNDETIYYIRTRDDEKNRLYSEEQKEQIEPYLKDYMKDNDEGILTLYVPLVVRVKDGQVISGHQGTAEDHDAHESGLTQEETEELKAEIDQIISVK